MSNEQLAKEEVERIILTLLFVTCYLLIAHSVPDPHYMLYLCDFHGILNHTRRLLYGNNDYGKACS